MNLQSTYRSNRHAFPKLCPYCTLLVIGAAAMLAGGWMAPARLWANLLLMAFLAAGVGLAGLLFLSFHYLTGARWSEPLRPMAESFGKTLPFSAAALGAAVLCGLGNYPWMHAHLAEHPTFWFKAAWLGPGFFAVRTIVYVVIWSGLAILLVRASQRNDAAAHGARLRRSALFLVVFSLTFWLATTDWIMSLEPEWYSTIFAVYHFAGVFASGLAAMAVGAVWAQRHQPSRPAIGPVQLHDLGKLLFGFSCFWMYIWFSQYMLIWYANISEETVYFVRRAEGLWAPLFMLNLALNWGIPFFVLLPRAAKRSAGVLLKISLVMLAGRWLDLYLSIVPPLGVGPLPGLVELGVLLAAAGGIGRWRASSFRAARKRAAETAPPRLVQQDHFDLSDVRRPKPAQTLQETAGH
jgi:hypothetical protein